MIPVELRITRFRSFVKETSFKFPKGAGLFFLWGENQAEPRLEANGAGKSSLWEALTWCFYGKTSRGLKAGDVANWEDGKGCRVEFDFEVQEGSGIMTAVRQWGPNSWFLIDTMGDFHDLAKDEDNFLFNCLRLDFGAFLQCIMLPQATRMFLDLKAEEKASLFSEVMGLDRWLDLSQRAGKAATEQDRISRSLEREIAGLEGELRQLGNLDIAREHEAWETKRKARVKEVDSEHSRLCDHLGRAHRYFLDAQDAEDRARASFRALPVEEDKPCPHCGQKMPGKGARRALEAREILDRAQDDTKRARVAKEGIAQQLDRLEQEAERIEQEKNPYADQLRNLDERVMRTEDAILDLRQDLDDSNESFALKQSWVRWFKEIRLGLISEALTHLEIEVNSGLNQLGLVGWELRFAVDAENRSGNITRGFSVMVISPHNEKPVPWEAWSGGESQRLRLGAQQGLTNLIRARSGTQLNLEVWDEPTQWMSGQGVTDLLDSLAHRAKAEGRQIWIVDHRSLGYGGFDGSVGAIKDESGTHFESNLPYISA